MGDQQRKKIIEDFESKLVKAENRVGTYEEQYSATLKTQASLKDGIQTIFNKLGFGSDEQMKEILGNGGVTESNMMQYLGIVEARFLHSREPAENPSTRCTHAYIPHTHTHITRVKDLQIAMGQQQKDNSDVGAPLSTVPNAQAATIVQVNAPRAQQSDEESEEDQDGERQAEAY